MSVDQKEIVEQLKTEWKKLWQERLDDKIRAEGVAITDYSSLFVDKGTIIHATRDYKALNFKEILEQHQINKAERFIPPDKNEGGWKKFIKTNLRTKTREENKISFKEKKVKQQPKKGGRGWLHK